MRLPGGDAKFLISHIGDGTVSLAELTTDGKLQALRKAQVGKAPNRVAFLS